MIFKNVIRIGLLVVCATWSQTTRDVVAAASLQNYLDAAASAPELFPHLQRSSVLGQGIPVLQADHGDSVSQYFYPVFTNGSPTSLIRVIPAGNTWQAMELGFFGLSKMIGRVLEAWPASEGYSLVLSTTSGGASYSFSIPEYAKPNLTPLDPGESPNKEDKPYKTLNLVREN